MNRDTRTDRDIAMKGGGYYSLATTGAKDVIDGGTALVLDAVAAMDIPDDGRPFTMADMGCADGGTSIGLVGAVLKEIRRRAPSRPLRMVYTDLPRNDFGQLFRVIHGQTEIRSYLEEIPDLYVYASATSFHQAIFPPATLNLAFSATASHYISEKPGNISNHVHMVGARGAERRAYEEQGRRDWEVMLTRRAGELVPGARLAFFNFGIDEQGRYLGNTGGVNMFDTFNEIWAGLAAEGVITQAEYLATNFPQCYRTVAQFTAPLKDSASPVYRAGLRLDHVETRVVGCPFARDFAEHGDAARFAKAYIPTLRSWSESTFMTGLSADRPPDRQREIIDRFYEAYEERVRRAPQGHAMDYVHIYLICSKR
jgi:indole-3-acetate O-methyltransferase